MIYVFYSKPVNDRFTDEAHLAAMLRFEAALAEQTGLAGNLLPTRPSLEFAFKNRRFAG